ncbi:endonuclease/exonuclease/phosphatase family protein [Micromonospora sp. CPCC 206061]|uniref:endonuclease/exonuclease/phosphatase family protein n=1 Tax=Micromonospora sp. CPCC 206061 TaxID=3122410 RepID=UPI002FEF3AA0
MLSLLTLNIQAAAKPRAQALLAWLDERADDLVILTETSTGEGTAYLLNQARQAGLTIVKTPDPPGERGVAILSRVPIIARPDLAAGVTLPGRVAAATIPGEPDITVLGVYVPSSDRAPAKVARKRDFIASLLAALKALPATSKSRLVLGGDYNVIRRDHQPSYRGFLPFEYAMLDTLDAHALVDAQRLCSPGVQEHSWIGRSGNGYQFDYFHIGAELAGRLETCRYLHEPRERGLSDHAAVSLCLHMPVPAGLPIDASGMSGAGALF